MVFSDPSQPISSNVLLYQIFKKTSYVSNIGCEREASQVSQLFKIACGVGSYLWNYLSFVQKEKKSRSSDSAVRGENKYRWTLHYI
jgi:hypothetical protein